LTIGRSHPEPEPHGALGGRRRYSGKSTIHGRLLLGACVVVGFGVFGLGYNNLSGAATKHRHSAYVERKVHPAAGTATTSSTLPQCGATRDPFDPTGAPPPAGSPAIC
jgi:hypothetical protein